MCVSGVDGTGAGPSEDYEESPYRGRGGPQFRHVDPFEIFNQFFGRGFFDVRGFLQQPRSCLLLTQRAFHFQRTAGLSATALDSSCRLPH